MYILFCNIIAAKECSFSKVMIVLLLLYTKDVDLFLDVLSVLVFFVAVMFLSFFLSVTLSPPLRGKFGTD